MTFDTIANWYTGIDAVTVGNPSAGHLTFVWAADLNGINIPDGKFFDIGFDWIGGNGVQSMITWSDNPTPREFGDFDGNIFVPIYINGTEISLIPGIPEIGIASNSVYPNPATDVINVKVSNDIRTVQVMNNLGMKKMMPKKAANDTIEEIKPKVNYVKIVSKTVLGILTGFKDVSFSYSENNGTLLPGFTPKPDAFGNRLNDMAPGLGFVFGSQKDIRYTAADNGWLSMDSLLNNAMSFGSRY